VRTRVDVSPPIDPRRFEDALEGLIAHLNARWYSKALVKHMRTMMRRFFAYLRTQRVRDLRAVTEAHVEGFARHIATVKSAATGRHYTVSTQRTQLYVVRRFFAYLERQRVIMTDPSLNLPVPSWKKLPSAVPNRRQIERLIGVPDTSTVFGKRDRAILEVLYGAAIRVGECERLDVKDLDLAHGRLFIRTGKGRKDRVVPVVGRAAAALDEYLRASRPVLVTDPSEPALFLARRGRRYDVKHIQALVRNNAKAAGLDIRVTPHTLRHGCATHLLQGGADVRHVQKLLGHSSIESTAVYTKVAATDLSAAVSRAHPRERQWKRKPKPSS